MTTHRSAPPAGNDASGPRPLWNPYLAGVLLGLVLLAAFLTLGQGLGASGAFSALLTEGMNRIAPEHVAANPVYNWYLEDGTALTNIILFMSIGVVAGAGISGWLGRRTCITIEKGPRISTGGRLAGALSGGMLVGIGAKLAKGCTSGQALTGGALLNVGSLVFMVAVFIAGYALAALLRKEWQ